MWGNTSGCISLSKILHSHCCSLKYTAQGESWVANIAWARWSQVLYLSQDSHQDGQDLYTFIQMTWQCFKCFIVFYTSIPTTHIWERERDKETERDTEKDRQRERERERIERHTEPETVNVKVGQINSVIIRLNIFKPEDSKRVWLYTAPE